MSTPAPTAPSPTAPSGAEPVRPAGPLSTAGPDVLGDGTTTRSRARSRWRRWRWPIAVAALVLLVAVLAALPEPRTSSVALAPDNPGGPGARALAQVLGDRGVEVTYVRTTGAAVDGAVDGSTLLVTNDWLLTTGQVDALAATDADLVLLDSPSLLAAVTDALTPSWTQTATRTAVDAACDDADALAAGTVRASGSGWWASGPGATVCFPVPGTDPVAGLYAVVEGDRRVTAIADPSLLTNASIAQDGNAALALRALGRHDHLTWYIPSWSDTGADEEAAPGLRDLLPPGTGVLALLALLVVAVAALWRARRLGRVVTEPLPVVVRSAETTRGRGRLYRRSRSYGHAAASLRAGTATRTARRLGLPHSAGAPAVIDALARATGRTPEDVGALLYGPPPTGDAGLTDLARRLDELESEVHRS